MEGTGRSFFFNEHRLRAGWRIAIFFALFFTLSIVGQLATGFLPAEVLRWLQLLVSFCAALVAGWIVLARLDGRPIGALGFAPTAAVPREIGWGLAIGSALIGAAFIILLATGAARFAPDAGNLAEYARVLVTTFLYFVLAAAWEEVLFRGYPFQALVEGIGAWPATLVSAALFSGLHAWNPNIDAIAFVNIFLAGVLLSVAYLRTRSLWFATAVHAGWNWTMASLIDFPVSGLVEGFDTPLYTAVETGADWWTGGAFGPEAGLAGTLALIGGTLWLLRTPHVAQAPEMRELGPIVDRRLGPNSL
jgi:membrane protease YdiL (CAAX protease family)